MTSPLATSQDEEMTDLGKLMRAEVVEQQKDERPDVTSEASTAASR
jgi:hypothetical protein